MLSSSAELEISVSLFCKAMSSIRQSDYTVSGREGWIVGDLEWLWKIKEMCSYVTVLS